MRITDLLKKDTMILNLSSTNKNAVINELINQLDKAGKLADPVGYRDAIIKREEQSTTGIGEGIAIPHAKSEAVKEASLCFGRSTDGIDYESLDGQPAHLFFMIAAPAGANDTHLETLSRLSSMLMYDDFRQAILKADSEDQILSIINAKQQELENEDSKDQPAPNTEEAKEEGFVLAVTACPTGIAHTYMAADALKAKAKEMNVHIKVETNGSTGVKNPLTDEDIKKASAIIVAADKNVEMDRFNGKHVIQVPVAQGIRKPEELINRALKQDAPVYEAKGGSANQDNNASENKGIGAQIYKHLMSGVSNMLPFVVGGGLLIALSFLFGGINPTDPKTAGYNEFAAALNIIGGGDKGAFFLLVPVLAGFIASSIADRPGFMPGMVGGLLAATAGAGFLGGLIAGFLAGYVTLGVKKAFNWLPTSLEGIKPVLLYPLFGLLITGLIMIFIINDPVVAMNKGLTHWLENLSGTNAVFLGLIVGGMMAVDMGGPINKAAFTFGIAAIAAGNGVPHAAVMAGGMVPPLGIALSTSLFKRKYTDSERKSGLTNYVMGASFITEGAIPFAAADPIRVIVSSIIGAATAGALSAAFGCSTPAPHGGIFVIGLIENPFMYALAIVIGSLVTAVLLGFWKKNATIKDVA